MKLLFVSLHLIYKFPYFLFCLLCSSKFTRQHLFPLIQPIYVIQHVHKLLNWILLRHLRKERVSSVVLYVDVFMKSSRLLNTQSSLRFLYHHFSCFHIFLMLFKRSIHKGFLLCFNWRWLLMMMMFMTPWRPSRTNQQRNGWRKC